MAAGLNKNNSAVKRIMQEARELAHDPCTDYHAAPLEDDIFEWHCTLRGSTGTEFEGGLYHFRILLPAEYPFRPPSIMMLTPNGRFELNTKICISFTNYHEELWQPAWGVRTAIIGLQGFFPLKGQAAVGVGSIEYPTSERKRLAVLSKDWVCPHCQQPNKELLPDPLQSSIASSKSNTELATQNPAEVPESCETSESSSVVHQPFIMNAEYSSSVQEIPPAHSGHISTIALDSNPRVITDQTPNPPTTLESSTTMAELSSIPAIRPLRRIGNKPPLLLDGAIMILLMLLFAILCRRMV